MDDVRARQQAAAGLLKEVLAALAKQGFEKQAVDRWTGHGYIVEHHYSGGDWELQIWRPGDPKDKTNQAKVRWSWRHDTLPTVAAVLSQIQGRGPAWPLEKAEVNA
jgi:hypothetical protein